MRDTSNFAASTRTLQCVASAGRVFKVVSRIFCSTSGVSARLERLRFFDLRMPSIPRSVKATRAARMVGRDKPVRCAIEWQSTKAKAQEISERCYNRNPPWLPPTPPL